MLRIWDTVNQWVIHTNSCRSKKKKIERNYEIDYHERQSNKKNKDLQKIKGWV